MSPTNAIKHLKVGTRDSPLAMAQTTSVIEALEKMPAFQGIQFEIVPLKAIGDLKLETTLSQLSRDEAHQTGSPIKQYGIFVKELEHHLLEASIDLAVHSLKDMPSQLPDGLSVIPFGKREAIEDAFISADGQTSFYDLPQGAIVGSSSVRRVAQLKRLRPDLNYHNIRGNVQTRLQKLESGAYQGTLLAVAGLNRLGLNHCITHRFCPETALVPAVGQGVIGLEFREHHQLATVFKDLRDLNPDLNLCVRFERQVMRELEGGCQLPLGCYAKIQTEGLHYFLHLLHPEATLEVRRQGVIAHRDFDKMPDVIHSLVHDVLRQGGSDILEALKK
jgi:hydroxymethylbilane synthase